MEHRLNVTYKNDTRLNFRVIEDSVREDMVDGSKCLMFTDYYRNTIHAIPLRKLRGYEEVIK